MFPILIITLMCGAVTVGEDAPFTSSPLIKTSQAGYETKLYTSKLAATEAATTQTPITPSPSNQPIRLALPSSLNSESRPSRRRRPMHPNTVYTQQQIPINNNQETFVYNQQPVVQEEVQPIVQEVVQPDVQTIYYQNEAPRFSQVPSRQNSMFTFQTDNGVQTFGGSDSNGSPSVSVYSNNGGNTQSQWIQDGNNNYKLVVYA